MITKKSSRHSLVALGAIVAINLFAATGYGESWSNEYSSPRLASSSGIVKGNVKGGDGTLSLLLVVGDQPAAYSNITNGLAALPEVGVVDTFDSTAGTPTVDQLLNYSCTVVWANFAHGDPVALGDNLADYADLGGGVIASTPSRIGGIYYIGGRFLNGGYDPMFNGSGPEGPSVLGDFVADHPAMTMPYEITDLFGDFRERTSLRPDVEDVARWMDNLPLLAISGSVAGDAAFLHNGRWNGEFPELLVNTCLYITAPGGK